MWYSVSFIIETAKCPIYLTIVMTINDTYIYMTIRINTTAIDVSKERFLSVFGPTKSSLLYGVESFVQ